MTSIDSAKLNFCTINIISQGGGYGESIIIHLGNGDWIIVDCCVDRETGTAIPLLFLEENDIDLSNVKRVICTHWHKDHINGMPQILEKCNNAKFVFARANDKEKFAEFIELDFGNKHRFENSMTSDFRQCLINCKKSGTETIRASCDQVLYSQIFSTHKISVNALSPSEKVNKDYDIELSDLTEKASKSNIRIPSLTPNDKSVVLLLEIGHHTVLLGADLEVKKDDQYGWLNITRFSNVVSGSKKSTLFKIPHHGSENGYHDEIWELLLEKNPFAIITPYSKSSLPNDNMLNKYNELTESLHLTAEPKKYTKPKRRDRQITKTILNFNSTVKELKKSFGIVSFSIDITSEEAKWSTAHSGEAFQYS